MVAVIAAIVVAVALVVSTLVTKSSYDINTNVVLSSNDNDSNIIGIIVSRTTDSDNISRISSDGVSRVYLRAFDHIRLLDIEINAT